MVQAWVLLLSSFENYATEVVIDDDVDRDSKRSRMERPAAQEATVRWPSAYLFRVSKLPCWMEPWAVRNFATTR